MQVYRISGTKRSRGRRALKTQKPRHGFSCISPWGFRSIWHWTPLSPRRIWICARVYAADRPHGALSERPPRCSCLRYRYIHSGGKPTLDLGCIIRSRWQRRFTLLNLRESVFAGTIISRRRLRSDNGKQEQRREWRINLHYERKWRDI